MPVDHGPLIDTDMTFDTDNDKYSYQYIHKGIIPFQQKYHLKFKIKIYLEFFLGNPSLL